MNTESAVLIDWREYLIARVEYACVNGGVIVLSKLNDHSTDNIILVLKGVNFVLIKSPLLSFASLA